MAIEKMPKTGEIWSTRNRDGVRRYYLVLKNFGTHISYLNLLAGEPGYGWIDIGGFNRYRYVDPSRIGFRYCIAMEDFVDYVPVSEMRKVFETIQDMYSVASL